MVENKDERSRLLKILLMTAPAEGFKIEDIVRITGEKYRDINYALSKMNEGSLKTPSYGHYRYEPTVDEIEFAKAVIKTVKVKK